MGTCATFPTEVEEKTTSVSTGHWRKKLSKNESRKVYTRDGTIPSNASDGVLALRVFLEDPASIVKFAEFAKRREKLSLLLCWIEVLEYKKIEGGNGYKLSQGSHIYHKYFKEDAVVQLGITSTHSKEECDHVLAELNKVEADPDAMLPPGLFDKFGQECLVCIYEQLFVAYRQSKFYEFTLKALKQQVNHVGVDDFEYMEFLGQGSYGVVVHCKKKSTDKHYAMKIQAKVGLINTFSDCPKRVTYEKEALAKCHHPFIVSMDYAFQTPELAIMVTALGTGENLHFSEPISEERTIFYAAEIVLALNHIHQLGMIYRDLKPANVLLNADGHIQLVDMGGVVDVGGRMLGQQASADNLPDMPAEENAVLFAPATGNTIMSVYAGSKIRSSKMSKFALSAGSARGGVTNSVMSPGNNRANSIMGTSGFMAPEMLDLLRQDPDHVVGYTKAVDYWSLGVLIHVLVTGKLPFDNNDVAEFVEYTQQSVEPPSYTGFRTKLSKLHGVSATCKQIMLELLTIDEKKRLGSAGIASVKKHPWFGQNKFGSMPWSLLGKKLVRPPGHCNAGAVPPIIASYVYPSFSAMLVDCNAGGFTDWAPTTEQQSYFDTWDYVAPHVLKAEMGAEEEEEEKRYGASESEHAPGLFTVTDSEMNLLNSGEHSAGGKTASNSINLIMKSFGRRRSSATAPPESLVTSSKPSLTAAKRGSNSSVTPASAAESLGSFGTTKSANSIANIGNHLKTLDT